jgi:hypothetical protein
MILLLFVNNMLIINFTILSLSYLRKGQNRNEHTPQDRIRKMSSGIRSLSFIGSYLKKVFWPNLRVGSSLQLLGILEYACGLNLGPALTLNQNPIFEMASTNSIHFHLFKKPSHLKP